MADLPPHREGPSHSSGNTFPTVGVSWDATAPSNLQRSLSPTPPGHHADIQQNTVRLPVNRSALGQIGGNGGVTPVPVVAQGRPQHPHRLEFGHYHPPPLADLATPHMYHNVGVNNYARVIRGVPAQAQVIVPQVPEIQEHDIFGDVAQHPPAGTAPDGLNAWPHEVPVPGEPATEILRQLASRYLEHPDSQVDTVRVELSPTGGFRVIIALEIQVGGLL